MTIYLLLWAESLRRNGVAIIVSKSPKCSTWMQSQKWQNDPCSFPRQTIRYHGNPSLRIYLQSKNGHRCIYLQEQTHRSQAHAVNSLFCMCQTRLGRAGRAGNLSAESKYPSAVCLCVQVVLKRRTLPCTIMYLRTKPDLPSTCPRDRPFPGWLWRPHRSREHCGATSLRMSAKAVTAARGKTEVWPQHLSDPNPAARTRGGCKNHAHLLPGPCVSSLCQVEVWNPLTIPWDQLSDLWPTSQAFFSLTKAPWKDLFSKQCSRNAVDRGNRSKLFFSFNHHAKFAADTSSMPTYCMLLSETYC